jgi:hypothetical protein
MSKLTKPSLAETHPEIASQADGWDPHFVWAGSYKKMQWKCASSHVWDASVSNRSRNGTGCPVCANRKVLAGFNDLATTHPELAKEADGWDPTSVTAGSHQKMSWKCELGHAWITKIVIRKSGFKCPYCSNYKALSGFNDLATTHPEIAKEADGWDPTSAIAGSQQKVKWKCQLGHTWIATLGNRTFHESGCPFCRNKRVLIGFNDLATTKPELAIEADGWDPTLVTFGSGKKLSWKCNLGHQWKAMVASRSLGIGCPICANMEILSGYNDLATTHPQLSDQADGWDPTQEIAGSHKKMHWKCQLGHTWEAQIHSRSGSETGCPICSHKKLHVGFNDLATTHPELAQEADGWDPTLLIAGSKEKMNWKCQLGHTWIARLNSRSQGSGCPSCAKTGFDPNQLGFLYLIDHFDLQMFQIGITNFPDKRLDKHGRSGWEIIDLRGPMDGHLTQQLETNCLHALEKRGAVLGHKAEIDKFDGYSEAWTKASLNVTSIKQILDWVYEDESK